MTILDKLESFQFIFNSNRFGRVIGEQATLGIVHCVHIVQIVYTFFAGRNTLPN